MPNTPNRGYPYQSHGHSPDGADLGEDLALAIDTDMATTEAALQADIDTNAADIASLEADLAAGYLFQQTVFITANGTFDKADYPGLRAVRVHCYGGGGAGGGSQTGAAGNASKGGGGGSGGYSMKWILEASLAASETVNISTGGTGVSAAAGNAGSGNTSFGTHCVALPGSGGGFQGTATGGSTQGGTGGIGGSGTGDHKVTGGPGGPGYSSAGFGVGGNGGDTPGPHGGRGGVGRGGSSTNLSLAGNTGQAYGGGGAGAVTNTTGASQAGGNGAIGVCVVDIFV